MSFWEGFSTYIGVQGLLALGMATGYIAAPYAGVILPDGFTELMSLTFGFYFAKNGVGIISALRSNR